MRDDCRGPAVGLEPGRTLSGSVGTTTARNAITLVLPEIESVIAALAADLADSQDELRARVRLAYLSTMVAADSDDLEAAIDVLRARAAGDLAPLDSAIAGLGQALDGLLASAR